MEPADRPDQGTAEIPAVGAERESRWLTEDERDAWIPLIGVLIKLPAALDAQLQRDAGLSHFEYMVLSRLSEAPARTLRMSDLAILANGSLSRLSHVVTRLERRGWARREACPEDGRYTNAVLTGEGWAKVAAIAPGHVAAVRQLVVDALRPEQVGQLRDIAQAIMSRVVPGDDWLGSLPHPARRLFICRLAQWRLTCTMSFPRRGSPARRDRSFFERLMRCRSGTPGCPAPPGRAVRGGTPTRPA